MIWSDPARTSHRSLRARVLFYDLHEEGPFPNNERLPAVVYRDGFQGAPNIDPTTIERVFERHGWSNGWRDGVYDFHHYHSTAHEVLGCYSGEARLQLGGPAGPVVELRCGDVLVLPAGVSHKRLSASPDFRVVGCYAGGAVYDMNTGSEGERPAADERIGSIALPSADPLYGPCGPLMEHWW